MGTGKGVTDVHLAGSSTSALQQLADAAEAEIIMPQPTATRNFTEHRHWLASLLGGFLVAAIWTGFALVMSAETTSLGRREVGLSLLIVCFTGLVNTLIIWLCLRTLCGRIRRQTGSTADVARMGRRVSFTNKGMIIAGVICLLLLVLLFYWPGFYVYQSQGYTTIRINRFTQSVSYLDTKHGWRSINE